MGVSNKPWKALALGVPGSTAVPTVMERGGGHEQEQCREPECQRRKADDPGCLCSVCGGFHDAPGISSRAVGMFLVEEVQRNISDQQGVENDLG